MPGRSDIPEFPCPVHATYPSGRVEYCEQGDEGHWGTCIGSRTKAEYDRLVAEVKAARRAIRAGRAA